MKMGCAADYLENLVPLCPNHYRVHKRGGAGMLINANALHIPLADGSVHTIVTSPPY